MTKTSYPQLKNCFKLASKITLIVFAYAAEGDLKKYLPLVVQYCSNLKEQLSQEAIALELNGEMYFI